MKKRIRRCDDICHNSKGTRCSCVCGGYFHGKNGDGAAHRLELQEGLTTLGEHGFEKGKARYVSQLQLPGCSSR
jgi:hypothetical protein